MCVPPTCSSYCWRSLISLARNSATSCTRVAQARIYISTRAARFRPPARARRSDAHIEALYVLRPPQIFASEGIAIPGGYITELADEERSLAERAKERFDAALADAGISQRALDSDGSGVSASWREVEGLEPLIVGNMVACLV